MSKSSLGFSKNTNEALLVNASSAKKSQETLATKQ